MQSNPVIYSIMYYVISVNIQQYQTPQVEQHSFITTQITQSLSWRYKRVQHIFTQDGE